MVTILVGTTSGREGGKEGREGGREGGREEERGGIKKPWTNHQDRLLLFSCLQILTI